MTQSILRLSCISLLLACVPLLSAKQPNVVFLISDDQNWDDYGFMGHPHIQTPHLDQLARESVVYERGYVSAPLCRPSLASMATGLHPSQHRIRGNDPILPGRVHRRDNLELFAEWRPKMSAPMNTAPSFIKALQGEGYLTLQTGKWWEGNPLDHGFTAAMTHGDTMKGGRHGDQGLRIGRETQQPYYDFVDKAVAENKPFFVWYGIFLPHAPHDASEALYLKYKDVAPDESTARYWANVEWFDEACGEVLDYLDHKGIAEDTIIVYACDNGWVSDPERVGNSIRSKREPYEAGIRTPIMIRYPKQVSPLRDKTTLVSTVDIAPTILRACGITVPAAMKGLDLRDPASLARRNQVVVEDYAHDIDLAQLDDPNSDLESRVLISGWDKIIEWPDHTELYDLKTDVADQHDLAAHHPEKTRKMEQALATWLDAHSPMVDHFADNGWGNPLAVVQQPAGVHHEGVTYVAYQGPLEDPYVAAYHHDTGEWQGPFKAGISAMGKDPDRLKKIDNHGKPTLIIDDAGYLHVFYGGHGGTPEMGPNPLGNHHDGRNTHAVSRSPLDITAWEDLDNISPFGTYNQALKMENGDLYLFYRHGAHRSDWVYQKSTDNGHTFAAPVSFLQHQRRDDLPADDSWYPWIGHGEGDDLIVSYDYHLCSDADADGRDGLGHSPDRFDVFFMIFDTATDTWRNVNGDSLEMPVTREYAEKMTFVASTGDYLTFNGSSHLDSAGHPHIGINLGKPEKGEFHPDKRTVHYRWTGQEWVGGLGGGMPSGRGDFLVSDPMNIRFLHAAKGGTVAWWNSTDGGTSFSRGKALLERPGAGLTISALIRNPHPDARVIVAEKIPKTDWSRVYLLGDNGPLQRPRTDANTR